MQSSRTSMFIPYKSLKGFDEYISQKEKVTIEEKELFEDTLYELNYQIRRLKIGDIITVIYKSTDYKRITGKISDINLRKNYLQLAKTIIKISSIIKIEDV